MKHIKLVALFFLITSGNSAFAMATNGMDYILLNDTDEAQTVIAKEEPFKNYIYEDVTDKPGPNIERSKTAKIIATKDNKKYLQISFNKDVLNNGVIIKPGQKSTIGRIEYARQSDNPFVSVSYKTNLEFTIKGSNRNPDRTCKLNFQIWKLTKENELMAYSYENNADESSKRKTPITNWDMYRHNRTGNESTCAVMLPNAETLTSGSIIIKILNRIGPMEPRY